MILLVTALTKETYFSRLMSLFTVLDQYKADRLHICPHGDFHDVLYYKVGLGLMKVFLTVPSI